MIDVITASTWGGALVGHEGREVHHEDLIVYVKVFGSVQFDGNAMHLAFDILDIHVVGSATLFIGDEGDDIEGVTVDFHVDPSGHVVILPAVGSGSAVGISFIDENEVDFKVVG